MVGAVADGPDIDAGADVPDIDAGSDVRDIGAGGGSDPNQAGSDASQLKVGVEAQADGLDPSPVDTTVTSDSVGETGQLSGLTDPWTRTELHDFGGAIVLAQHVSMLATSLAQECQRASTLCTDLWVTNRVVAAARSLEELTRQLRPGEDSGNPRDSPGNQFPE